MEGAAESRVPASSKHGCRPRQAREFVVERVTTFWHIFSRRVGSSNGSSVRRAFLRRLYITEFRPNTNNEVVCKGVADADRESRSESRSPGALSMSTFTPALDTSPHHQRRQQQQAPPPSDTSHARRASSPVAPAYSPLTPKVQPILPAAPFAPPPENGGNFTFSPPVEGPSEKEVEAQKQAIPPAEYRPQPPNQPFSSDDATDAIALRAAISTLQFQKQKARDDLKTLASIKQLALDDPARFREELAAGKLREQRPKVGNIRAILDKQEADDDDDEVVLGASRETEAHSNGSSQNSDLELPEEIPDSQPSQPPIGKATSKDKEPNKSKPFPQIPGPQNVVRMPYVNWDKYGIVGEPLETMHEQQKRWPGTASGYGVARGREHTVAAPYSPFLDKLDYQDEARKDSAGNGATPPGTISEHPMETRSRH